MNQPVAYCTVSLDFGTAPTKNKTTEAQFLGHSISNTGYSQVWFTNDIEPTFVHRSRILSIRWA